MSEEKRPLQITDVVAAQPISGRSIEGATAPSVNSVPAGAEGGSVSRDAISTMNAHLRQERTAEGKRAWPERLASNKAEAIAKFESRKRHNGVPSLDASETLTSAPAGLRRGDDAA
jgi:hypothetical protein